MGDGPGGKREPAQTPRRMEGHRAAINGLEGHYCEHVKGKSKGASDERARQVEQQFVLYCNAGTDSSEAKAQPEIFKFLRFIGKSNVVYLSLLRNCFWKPSISIELWRNSNKFVKVL